MIEIGAAGEAMTFRDMAGLGLEAAGGFEGEDT